MTSELEQAYYGLLQARQSVDINLDNLNVSKDLLEKVKKKFELGSATQQEVLSAEYGYAKADTDYKAAVNSYKKAAMDLNIKLGFDVMTELKLKDELESTQFDPGSIADAVSKALASRNEIKASEYKYALQKITTETERVINDISYNYRLEKLNLEKAAEDLETCSKNIEKEVRSNYLDVLQKQEEIDTNRKMVEKTAETLKNNELKYETGVGLLTDAQSAQVDYMNAQLALSSSILDYNLAVSAYKDSISVERTRQ